MTARSARLMLVIDAMTAATIVAHVMSRKPITVDSRVRVPVAERIARLSGVHHLLMVEGDSLVGVVCCCDLARARRDAQVGSLELAPTIFILADSKLETAATMMLRCGVGCLPVLDADGVLAGVISRRDLRIAGYLPGAWGRDLCTTCGTGHGLRGDGLAEAQVFCRSCMRTTLSSGNGAYST